MDLINKELEFDISVKQHQYAKAKKAKKIVVRKLITAFFVFLVLFVVTYLLLKEGGGRFYSNTKRFIFVSSLSLVFIVSFVLINVHFALDLKLVHYLKVVQIYDIVQFLLIALFLIFFFQMFVIRPSNIKGSSMEPTLLNKDRVLVLQLQRNYKKDDVIVFDSSPYPLDSTSRQNGEVDFYIKRVKGLPGETIMLQQVGSTVKYEIIINGEKVRDYNDQSIKLDVDSEHYKDLNNFINQAGGVIPLDGYFVLGDNTNNSKDSRTLGFILKEDILGKAIFRLSKEFGRIK